MLTEQYLHTLTTAPHSKIESVFRHEGRDYFSDTAVVREAKKEEKSARKIERVVRTVFKIAEKTGDVADTVTATSLSALTLMRKSGFRGGLMPWEVWNEERGSDLKETHQRRLVRDWLSDSLFDKDVLHDFERVSPEFAEVWGNRFDTIADHMIDSPAKSAIGSVILSFMEGTATISAEASGGMAVGRIFAGQVSKAIESLSFNVNNEMRGIIQYLAADIRQVISPYDSKLEAETISNQIITAGISEFMYRLSMVSAVSSWFGSSAGITAVGLLRDGVSSLGRSAAYSGGMLAAIGYLGKHFRVGLLQRYSADFAHVTNEISGAVQRRIRLADVEFTPGLSQSDELLQEQRHAVTKEKNYVAGAVADGLPSTLSSAAYLFHSGSDYAGLALTVGRSVKEILAINDTYVAFQASIAARTRAFRHLQESLAHVQGDRAPLTDALLGDYLHPGVDWTDRSFLLGLQSVGIPHVLRREKNNLAVVQAVDEQTYYLERGSICLLIGENGDGKSTLIKTLTGEYAGNIRDTDITWSGYDVRAMSAVERRKRVFSLTNTIRGDFRQLVGTILLKYDSALTRKQYDPSRIRHWVVSNDEDTELESDVLAYFSNNELLKGMDRSWFKRGYTPSGYEGAVLNYAAHLSIREPVLMIIDEFDNGMTVGNLKAFQQCVDTLMEDFSGGLIVCSNKHIAGWLELRRTSGFIDMRDGSIIDRKLNVRITEKLVQKEKLAEYQSRFENRQPMSLVEFYDWMMIYEGPRELHIKQMKRHYEELGYDSFEINFKECGIQEWENGPYGQYLLENMERWISEIATPQEMLVCMRILNLFYCTHIYLDNERNIIRRDRNDLTKVGQNWSIPLRRQFNERLNYFIEDSNSRIGEIRRKQDDQPDAYIFAHQFTSLTDISSNFLRFYAHNYSIKRREHIYLQILTRVSSVGGELFRNLFDDPIFIYAVGNFGIKHPMFQSSLITYIRSCASSTQFNGFLSILKSCQTTGYLFGERIDLWDSLLSEPWFVETVEERLGRSVMSIT